MHEERGWWRFVAHIDNSLVIRTDEIERPRQEFRRALTRAFLEEALAEMPAWSAREPSEVVALLTKMSAGGGVLLEGSASVGVRSACRRCLRDVDSTVNVTCTLNLVSRNRSVVDADDEGEDDGEGALAGSFGEDADEEPYDGERVDLGPIMREQLLLALPAIEPLCKDDCLGLCTTCGQDLNEKDCGHSQKVPDPRWAALQNIKLS